MPLVGRLPSRLRRQSAAFARSLEFPEASSIRAAHAFYGRRTSFPLNARTRCKREVDRLPNRQIVPIKGVAGLVLVARRGPAANAASNRVP